MLVEKIFDQLLEISLLFQADLDRSMSALGLTVTKTHLLWEVHQNGPCPQQRLAEALNVSARHVTALVDALEVDDFARRSPHPQDRRAVLIELTDKGTATLAEMQRQRSRAAAALVDGLDAGAIEELHHSLDTVLGRLRQLVADADGTDGTDGIHGGSAR
jgi:DNA-binding MarR family transcriptional regulator